MTKFKPNADTHSWRELILDHMDRNQWGDNGTGESWSDVVACTLTDAELDEQFDNHLGCVEGKPFTLWTAKRVYFPVKYDGEESVRSVAREPDAKATNHVGG